ncbi:HEAT repeat domain-containing protein [Streptomyces sp. NBC_01693]|uniref:HEAT repeat domain-containing protein n=1 Tax=Streptomyces sp. NBC_01693 TaxID=2975912 RepID=UPI002E34D91F|nr:HEAT repeat domain-containing protein [Streptomyces sp. NBC_01693]
MTTTPADAWTPRRQPGRDTLMALRPVSGLRPLIGHTDRRTRYRGLSLLAERAARPRLPAGEAAELAALLPRDVPGPPDESLLLAGLYGRLGIHLPSGALPDWRAAAPPAPVRIAWLRAEILTDPSALRHEQPGETLHRAVRAIDAGDAHRPDRLVAEVLGARDPVLRAEAVRLIRQGLHAGLLAPGPARDQLAGLLGTGPDDTSAAAAALEELAEPWAASEPLPASRFSPYLGSVHGAPVTALALAAAARHGHGPLLMRTAADPGAAPEVRRRALDLLGGLAERGDIGALLDIAAQDPLLLAGPAIGSLQGLHRRGHFPEASQAPAVVALALADHSIDPRTVATVLYTCRRTVLDLLSRAPADDPGGPRRLALLVALAGQGTGDLPIGEAVTRMLPSARLPGPYLEAIRELRHEEAEEAVLALLPDAPAAVLDTLEAIGGQRTVAALTEALGPDTDGSGTAPFLRPVRHRALELLWQLNTDPELRRHLLARFDPAALPPAVAADLGAPDERELALLTAGPEPSDPVAALCALAAHGSAATLPAVTGLLLRVVGELAASWETVDTGPLPEPARAEEPVVPQEIVDAVRGLGGRLHERRRIRPSCLVGAQDVREAGDALLAGIVLDLLEQPDLPAREQSVLLEVLRRAPSARTRPRVHRLVRHRDPQVRKQAIALLATGATGEDAQALSATLIALTRTDDIRTVRQALLALGRAEARWACTAVAALLDHPTMNIRKTAASVLASAGTQAAVPGLLRSLGRDDNPGLRTGLVAALRAVLGGAWTATLLAAAARTGEPRARALLLRGLDGALASRTVLALAAQGSPVVPDLLALVADGRIRLGTGSATADLAELSAEYGITHSAHPRAGDADSWAADLADHGWSAPVALRLADSPDALRARRLPELRPMLEHWLDLAAAVPEAARDRVLGLVVRLCPAPWPPGELDRFAGYGQVLTEGLAGERGHRAGLLSVLGAVAPRLSGPERVELAGAVRALSPPEHVGALRLLRACDAVPVREDVDRALAAARLDAHVREAETAVLREVFSVPELPGLPELPEPSAAGRGAEAWRSALLPALRTRRALEEFRRRAPGPPDSGQLLAALMAAYPEAGDDGVRGLLVDRMTDLRPLGVPPWTPAGPIARASEVVRAGDPDRPHSAAWRTRLLDLLEGPDAGRRSDAARQLLGRPEPETAHAVLGAYLRGRVDLPPGDRPARALAAVDPPELRAKDVMPARVVVLARQLGPWDLVPLIPLLLGWWEDGPAALRADAAHALRSAPADVLAEHLLPRLEAGAWGLLDLLAGLRLLGSPELRRIRERLRAEGRDDLAGRLLLDEGPGSVPRPPAPAGTVRRPGRAELLRLARTGGPEQIRRALTRLTEEHTQEHGGRSQDPGPGLEELIGELLHHPRPKVRLHAHRTSRALLDRPSHLLNTAALLEDPQPDIRRMAIRTLCHARWEPAVPALVALLDHAHPPVRKEAADGLLLMGAVAVPALRHAAGQARPDRRSRYTGVLERLTGSGEGPSVP